MNPARPGSATPIAIAPPPTSSTTTPRAGSTPRSTPSGWTRSGPRAPTRTSSRSSRTCRAARPSDRLAVGRRGWQPVPFLPVAALLIVLSIVTHLPFWILIFFVGCGLFARRRMQAWR